MEKRDGSMGGNEVMRRLMWKGVMGSGGTMVGFEVDADFGREMVGERELDWDGRMLVGCGRCWALNCWMRA